MNPAAIRRTLPPFILWLVIVCIFAFGAAVHVDFVEPEIPFSKAWDSMSATHAWGQFKDRAYPAILAISITGLVILAVSRSWKLRVAAMMTGFLSPVVLISHKALWLVIFTPLMILDALTGKASGEFYEEGMMMFAACGLWMQLCLAVAVWEMVKQWRVGKAAASHQP